MLLGNGLQPIHLVFTNKIIVMFERKITILSVFLILLHIMWFEDVYYNDSYINLYVQGRMQSELMYESIHDFQENEEYALTPIRPAASLFQPRFYVSLSLVPEKGNVGCRLCIYVL